MLTLSKLTDDHGEGTKILSAGVGTDNVSIVVIEVSSTSGSDIIDNLKERLQSTTAAFPFLLHGGFNGLLEVLEAEAVEEQPAAEAEPGTEVAQAEADPEAEARAKTAETEAEVGETEGAEAAAEEGDEEPVTVSLAADEVQQIIAVLVNEEVKHVFLLANGLQIGDDESYDAVIFGLTSEELATPSEALLAAFKTMVEWSDNEHDGYLYLLLEGSYDDNVTDKLDGLNPDDTNHETEFTIGDTTYSVVSFY